MIRLLKLFRDRAGQGLPEYALLIAAVLVMAVAVSIIFTSGVGALFNQILSSLGGPAT